MASFVSPDELVIGILHLMQGDIENQFPTDREQLHSAFHQLKQKYPDMLRGFRFRDRGLFFECEELDQTLFNLEASKLLHRHNDTPRYYFIQQQLHDSFEDYVRPNLSSAGIDEAILQSVAADFKTGLSCLSAG